MQSVPITNNVVSSWRGVLDITLCDKVRQLLEAGRWFSTGPPISSTNKTDSHDITEILLKVALNTITVTIYIRTINEFEIHSTFRPRFPNERYNSNADRDKSIISFPK